MEGINEVEPLGTKPGNDVADALKVMTKQSPLRWRQCRPKPIPCGLGDAGIIRNLLQCALENGLMTGAVTQVRGQTGQESADRMPSYPGRFTVSRRSRSTLSVTEGETEHPPEEAGGPLNKFHEP